MNSELPPTDDREALNADITTTRAELGRTLEAIAAKTQVKTRAKEAAQDAAMDAADRVATGTQEAKDRVTTGAQEAKELLIAGAHEAKDRITTIAQEARVEVTGWWQRLQGLPPRQRLSVAAVFAAVVGGLSATAVAVKSHGRGSKDGCR